MKVLYADSDPEVRDYVSMLLEAGLDCEILEASSGNEALSVLEFDHEIDFVISEVQMNGGGGHLIVDYLDSHKMEIPIVWLSDKVNHETMIVQEVLQRSPLNAFVPKPFRDDQFFPVIDKILEIQSNLLAKGQNTESLGKNLNKFDLEWDGLGPQEKKSFYDDADWSSGTKPDNVSEADWSLAMKKKNGEVEGDWGSLGSTTKDQEADWSLKNEFGNGKENVADYSLKKEFGNGKENVADYSLKKNVNAKEGDTLDYRKPSDEGWESIRKKNHEKKQSEEKTKSSEEKVGDELEYDMERFKRVKIKRFYNFDTVTCDVYIQLSPVKYIKLLNSNESYEKSFIEKYESRGKKYLFIESENYQRFQEQFGHLVLSKLEKAQNLPPDIIALAELAAFDHALDFAKEFGITANTANKVKKSVESNLKTLKKLPNLELLLKRIMRGGDYISEHSLMLSYFAGQICMATSWGSSQTLEKLSMAALLHDVALPKNSLGRIHSMAEAKEQGLEDEEIEVIRNHPGEAAKLISQGENIFADVDTIVMQHHELPDQSGFPRGLGALSISPLSCIFILASELTERIYGKPAASINMEEIKAEFKEKFNKGNFKKPLEALLKVF